MEYCRGTWKGENTFSAAQVDVFFKENDEANDSMLISISLDSWGFTVNKQHIILS